MNPVGWFEINVQDMARAVSFYEQVFGIKMSLMVMPGDESGMEMYVFPGEMEKPGASGALVKMDGLASGPGGSFLYFVCEDCAVEEKKAAVSGGKIIQTKMSLGEFGFYSVVQDSEGNSIGLHSMQ